MAYDCDILDPDQKQVLIDLETLSTAKNAAIVSIGATKFTLADGIIDTFSINIDPFSCKAAGLHICQDTLSFWKSQPKEVSDRWKLNPVPLKEALMQFAEWYGKKSVPTYGNSASFDCTITQSAFAAAGLPPLFNYREETCYRTICKLFRGIEYEPSTVLHDALEDALAETKHLLKILGS